MALHAEMGTRTTVIIKFKSDVNIMLSPLVLESLQRYEMHFDELQLFNMFC